MAHRQDSMPMLAAAALGTAALLNLSSGASSGNNFVTGSSLRGAAAGLSHTVAIAESSQDLSRQVDAQSSSTTTSAGLALAAGAVLAGGAARRQKRASASRQTARPVGVAMQARGGGGAIVVIAGPPAAGKGTQCEKIKEKYGFVHISTGDILRANVKSGTELGLKAKEFMDAGKLVPSELIVDLVKDRLAGDDIAAKGCLLDGFPRAEDQAQAMVDAGIPVNKFIIIKVPDDTLVERGCGRRLDPETGDIYHLKFKPPPADIADRLVHRSDDQEESIRERLRIYHSQVGSITPFFKECLVEVDGTGTPADVFELVQKGIDG
eukprot:TRINITY_DN15499_c0_g1_i2.p1 TRINITY_DN15499_c0_g1~~TRINITY_DN15499_c0_g1_i2.p1  ORF type:complete len:322 (-),score=107.23 TRINITY_DN15499_c0_g1_i2:152-1117(-)